MIRLPDEPEKFEQTLHSDAGNDFELDEFEVDYIPDSEPEIDLHEECRNFFSPGGTLSALAAINGRPTEERPQQLAMSIAIANALQKSENLAIEAPTGIGKSFAYLIPLIYRSQICRRPALISTETINLQQVDAHYLGLCLYHQRSHYKWLAHHRYILDNLYT